MSSCPMMKTSDGLGGSFLEPHLTRVRRVGRRVGVRDFEMDMIVVRSLLLWMLLLVAKMNAHKGRW